MSRLSQEEVKTNCADHNMSIIAVNVSVLKVHSKVSSDCCVYRNGAYLENSREIIMLLDDTGS